MTEPQLSVEDLKKRSASGIAVVGARGLALRAVSLSGLLVSASLLGPADFGVVAFGLSITFVAHFLSDGGLAPSLIQRVEPPTREEYGAVVALQAGITLAIVSIFATTAALSGNRTLIVTAVFLAALPMLAFRLPAFVSLERRLRFGPSVTAEILEVLLYNIWSIGGLLLGHGVYALATGAVVKTLSGTILLNAMSPVGWIRPRLRLGPIRPLLTFGLKFQGAQAIILARDQLLNVGIAAFGGYALLGIWAAAGRLISLPLLLFESLWRIAFPAFSRLREVGELSSDVVRKGVHSGAILSCGILAAVAAASLPAVQILLGPRWADVASLMPWLCLGLAIFGAIDVVSRGFLMAENTPNAVLTVYATLSVVMLGMTLPLLPWLGHWALAIGWTVGYGVGAATFAHALNRMIGVRLAPCIVPALGSSVSATLAALALAATFQSPAVRLIIGLTMTPLLYTAFVLMFDRSGTKVVGRLALQALPARRKESLPMDP